MTSIIVKDPLRDAVEAASGGKQTVLWTKSGFPTYMNVIPKFRCEDLHPTVLGTGTHPAFVVNGVEKSEIFIGTYQAVLQDGEALSLPKQIPATNINFDQAKAACLAAGPGFHLMTNWEWAAIALWCAANGHDVRGNTNYGKSHSNPDECGERNGSPGATLTGSGPDAWRHDGTPYGIADLVGNVWEWNDGVKLIGGNIVMPLDNAFDLSESKWPDTGQSIDGANGIEISNKISCRGWLNKAFKGVAGASDQLQPVSFRQAMLLPVDGMNLPGHFWADNSEGFEALPVRGGDWGGDSLAGLAALDLGCGRSRAYSVIGFRPAFIG